MHFVHRIHPEPSCCRHGSIFSLFSFSVRLRFWAHLDTTTGTQPSGCRGVSIAPCCSVNAAFLFAEPRMLVVVSSNSRASHAWKGKITWLNGLPFAFLLLGVSAEAKADVSVARVASPLSS